MIAPSRTTITYGDFCRAPSLWVETTEPPKSQPSAEECDLSNSLCYSHNMDIWKKWTQYENMSILHVAI